MIVRGRGCASGCSPRRSTGTAAASAAPACTTIRRSTSLSPRLNRLAISSSTALRALLGSLKIADLLWSRSREPVLARADRISPDYGTDRNLSFGLLTGFGAELPVVTEAPQPRL